MLLSPSYTASNMLGSISPSTSPSFRYEIARKEQAARDYLAQQTHKDRLKQLQSLVSCLTLQDIEKSHSKPLYNPSGITSPHGRCPPTTPATITSPLTAKLRANRLFTLFDTEEDSQFSSDSDSDDDQSYITSPIDDTTFHLAFRSKRPRGLSVDSLTQLPTTEANSDKKHIDTPTLPRTSKQWRSSSEASVLHLEMAEIRAGIKKLDEE